MKGNTPLGEYLRHLKSPRDHNYKYRGIIQPLLSTIGTFKKDIKMLRVINNLINVISES